VRRIHCPHCALGVNRPTRPGELVSRLESGRFCGFHNNGVVSSLWPAADPESPMVYVQTDAPINSGNSGARSWISWLRRGTEYFMMTKAVAAKDWVCNTATTIQFVSEELKRYGHVHRTGFSECADDYSDTPRGLD